MSPLTQGLNYRSACDSSSCTHLTATGCHLLYGITPITQCYLPPDTSERTPPNPAGKAGDRLTYPEGWMDGWVDLGG